MAGLECLKGVGYCAVNVVIAVGMEEVLQKGSEKVADRAARIPVAELVSGEARWRAVRVLVAGSALRPTAGEVEVVPEDSGAVTAREPGMTPSIPQRVGVSACDSPITPSARCESTA